MLVVISDLHFEEVKSDTVSPDGAHYPVAFEERNLSPRAFEVLFGDLSRAARADRAQQLDVVLAGDVFDLHRTTMWFEDGLRPYVACNEVGAGSALEAKVLRILDAIAAEPPVAKSLAAIRSLSGGAPARGAAPGLDLPPLPTRVHYLPGNHDRLANATPALRARVREILGLPPAPEAFPHVVDCPDPRVLVRHGHEYDPLNFGASLPTGAPIPPRVPDAYYDDWTFGDFITVEVAMGLPRTFRDVHGDAAIAADPWLSTVYRRLLEFDDVRPQSELAPFLLTIPDCDEKVVWKALEPVVRNLLDRIADSPHLEAALARGGVAPLWRLALDNRIWRLGLPLGLVRRLGALAARGDAADPARDAVREEVVERGLKRFVIAGHTHRPQVALLANRGGMERYFVDTGTWRNVVFSSGQGDFANAKALTYVVVYGSSEDPAGPGKQESFDYWSGATKRW